ncbi:MAG: hypothetical protein ACRBCT_00550 [Alphaproteobacteria bacterium]
MSPKKTTQLALTGGFNGGNGSDGEAFDDVLAIMLDTAFFRFPDEPHTYMNWALSMVDSAHVGDEFENMREDAHLYILKRQYDISNERGGWAREHLEEFENFLNSGDCKVFKSAFDRFLKYTGFESFQELRSVVNIHRPVTRLPSQIPGVVTLDFSRTN